MYIHIDHVRQAVSELEYIHPFFGLTYLVCKRARLPVGSTTQFPIDALETEFLDEYFKPFPESDYFFRLFRVSDKLKLWVHRTKYASSTLQSIRTRSAFSEAFLHERNTADWGWTSDYLGVLRASLSYNLKQYKKSSIPTFLLACWLYRDREFGENTSLSDILETFREEFDISETEQSILSFAIDHTLFESPFLSEVRITQDDYRELLGDPPDAEPRKGETLALLELQDVGPIQRLTFEPAERLNLVTGDNGLGKSFLLECAWWSLTGEWRSKLTQAAPRFTESSRPKIAFEIAGEKERLGKVVADFTPSLQSWDVSGIRPVINGLGIYGRVDGSFAVWNPIRQSMLNERVLSDSSPENGNKVLNISSAEIWNGIPGQIEGLLRDWVEWQNASDIENPESAFETLKRVLVRLSPPDLGFLEPGEPTRLPLYSQRIPTVKHRYGEVPIIYESAAVRRILALAYLIVWTWNEHLLYTNLAKVPVERRMVVLVDEIEAHLHPLWQRRVLPALLDYSEDLPLELQTQFFVATHSPLVLASAEAIFNERSDGLFHLDLNREGDVTFSELDFVRYGTVDSWLTSRVFDLRHARSIDADEAIEKAKLLQKRSEVTTSEVREATDALLRTLASDDDFWPRWIYFAEKNGVTI